MKTVYKGTTSPKTINFNRLRFGEAFIFERYFGVENLIFIRSGKGTSQTAVNLETGKIIKNCCGHPVIPLKATVIWEFYRNELPFGNIKR